MTTLSKLRSSLKHKSVVTIGKTYRVGNSCTGIVTALNDVFVAVQEVYDFEFDGTVVLQLDAIKSVQSQSFEKTIDVIFRYEGLTNKARARKWLLQCNNWEDLFLNLQRRDIWPSVHVVRKSDHWFLIGPLVSVEPEGSYIHYYGGNRKWEKTPDPVGYKWLRKLEFGDHYSKHFNSYMRTQPRPKAKS